MRSNPERVQRIQQALCDSDLDAVVATFAAHIVMLTGYWPVIGTSAAIVTRDGVVALLVPEDEEHLVGTSWAEPIVTYSTGGVASLQTPLQAIKTPLEHLCTSLGLVHAKIGYEQGPVSEPSSYAAMHIFGTSIVGVLRETLPNAKLVPADDMLEHLDSVKTPVELERIRTACSIVAESFELGVCAVQPGMTEAEIAAAFRRGLSTSTLISRDMRADGFAYCMSGENSARAFGAFAQTRQRRVSVGDIVLVHCNSYVDGYWTDVTRSYLVRSRGRQFDEWQAAIIEARAAAIAKIAPGVRAAEVDGAARGVFRNYGREKLFRHSTGHGVGFAAISATARPRLHPHSPDILEQGMVFNVEPGLYQNGVGGMRHCDMVVVTENGAEVLTPFQTEPDERVVKAPKAA